MRPYAQPLPRRPVFIVGSARSGTVLVGQILKRHPSVHSVIEHPVVFDLATRLGLDPPQSATARARAVTEMRESYQRVWSRRPAVCRSCISACREAGNVTRLTLRGCTAGSSILRYADKSHQLVLNIPLVLDAFPDAAFIHVLRDGRDAVASMLRHSGVLSWFDRPEVAGAQPFPSLWFGATEQEEIARWRSASLAEKCALRWASWVRSGLDGEAQVPADRWCEVRYEQLIADQSSTIRKLYDFVGVPTMEPGIRIRQGSIGAWRTRLSASDQRRFMDAAGSVLSRAGYDR